MNELPIIQKTYDFIKWYVPVLNRLPRNYRLGLGTRIINHLYDLLENLIRARFSTSEKLEILQNLNIKLDVIRHQTRLVSDFELISSDRYKHINKQIDGIGSDLGGWVKKLSEP